MDRFKEKTTLPRTAVKPKKPDRVHKMAKRERQMAERKYRSDMKAYNSRLTKARIAKRKLQEGDPVASEFTCARQFIADSRNRLLSWLEEEKYEKEQLEVYTA